VRPRFDVQPYSDNGASHKVPTGLGSRQDAGYFGLINDDIVYPPDHSTMCKPLESVDRLNDRDCRENGEANIEMINGPVRGEKR